MSKKRNIIIIILVIVLVLIGLYEYRTIKGYILFGNEKCKGHNNFQAGDLFTSWECEICGYKDVNPDTNTPLICANCSSITMRCQKCAKKLK